MATPIIVKGGIIMHNQILVLDPGKTTGYAKVSVDAAKHTVRVGKATYFLPSEYCVGTAKLYNSLWNVLDVTSPDVVAYETAPVKYRVEPHHAIAVIELYSEKNDVPTYTLTPSCKGFWKKLLNQHFPHILKRKEFTTEHSKDAYLLLLHFLNKVLPKTS